MLLTSITSILFISYFLPVFLLLYYAAPGGTRGKNLILLGASLLFYAWGEMQYLGVLAISIVANYAFGFLVTPKSGRKQPVALWCGIGLNLLLLVIYKYSKFVVGISVDNLQLLLPLGISFFTFKAISYLVDVSRGEIEVEHSLLNFGSYLAMFPQVVAGPIMRYSSAGPELKARSHSAPLFLQGAESFIVGLSQKMLIASSVAHATDSIFKLAPANLSASLAWLGAIAYTIQIYFDFAGYTNMAIGMGRMLGFHFPPNFRYPYASQSITDFWQRWHITLSTWFRDYLWFPLGANRHGKWRTYGNLVIVFALCGIWHGANYTFLVWGMFHGAVLVVERAGLLRWLSRLPRPLRTGYAILVIMIGWVIFRSDTISYALNYLSVMFGFGGDNVSQTVWRYLTLDVVLALGAGILFSFPWNSQTDGSFVQMRRSAVRWPVLIVLLALSVMVVAEGSHNAFLYFRF